MRRLLKLIENKWLREIILFTLLFIITILNDREGFVNPHELRDGFFIFLILYLHVQFQRFLILPYLIAKRYLIYGLLTLSTVFFFAVSAYFIDSWMSSVGWYDEETLNHGQLFLYYILCCSLSLPILLFVFFTVGYYKQQKLEADHQLLLKDMELSLLRTQLNPHFLFNSLNNLYGISLEKPAEVSEKIMQMSQIMRYQLELSKKEYVSLKEDLDFISDYIGLESDRVTERCVVVFQLNIKAAELAKYRIAPMILISFIENAFKHFSNDQGADKGYIHIDVGLKGAFLDLWIRNSAVKDRVNVQSTKIGLINTRKRLEILYPGKFSLNIAEESFHYALHLQLKLDLLH